CALPISSNRKTSPASTLANSMPPRSCCSPTTSPRSTSKRRITPSKPNAPSATMSLNPRTSPSTASPLPIPSKSTRKATSSTSRSSRKTTPPFNGKSTLLLTSSPVTRPTPWDRRARTTTTRISSTQHLTTECLSHLQPGQPLRVKQTFTIPICEHSDGQSIASVETASWHSCPTAAG